MEGASLGNLGLLYMTKVCHSHFNRNAFVNIGSHSAQRVGQVNQGTHRHLLTRADAPYSRICHFPGETPNTPLMHTEPLKGSQLLEITDTLPDEARL